MAMMDLSSKDKTRSAYVCLRAPPSCMPPSPLAPSLTRASAFSLAAPLAAAASSAFLATHKSNIALWSGFFVLVLFCYHLFSDGDFSFLMVRSGARVTANPVAD